MPFTASQLAAGKIMLRIGDMAYVPLNVPQGRVSALEEWLPKQPWFKPLKRNRIHDHLPIHALEVDYLGKRRGGETEPSWIDKVPLDIRAYLRIRWLTSDGFDPLAIVLDNRNLGFGYGVESDGLIHNVCAALNVFRLEGIRQLGFLHDPAIREAAGDMAVAQTFSHTRYCHSLDVMAVATLIGTNVGLSERDLLHLRVAAVSHDVLTPAGGDSIKLIDPAAFDEDAHYPEAFSRARARYEQDKKVFPRHFDEYGSWDAVCRQYEVDEKLLASIVRGEGVLGKLLDVADKCAYVARDADEFTMRTNPRAFQTIMPPASLVEIWDMIKRHPHVCGVWDSVRLIKGQVVITDPERLAHFLMLRTLMFKHLYYRTESRYKEQMIATAVSDHLYTSGVLTRDMLLRMSDRELEQCIDRATEQQTYCSWTLSYAVDAPHVERFATAEEAQRREQELVEQSNEALMTMVDPFYTAINTGVKKFLVRKGRKILPFADAYPGEAAEITGLAEDPTPVRLYWLPMDEARLPPKLQESLLSRQRQRLKKT